MAAPIAAKTPLTANPGGHIDLSGLPPSALSTPSNSKPATPACSNPPSPRAAVNIPIPASAPPTSGLTFRGHARPSHAPRTVTTMRRDNYNDDDEEMISTELHERLVHHAMCCTGVMCCFLGGVCAFLAYHEGLSAGRTEAAPRCLYDLNNCQLALRNLTKTYKKN